MKFSRRHSSSSTCSVTSTPFSRSWAIPFPATRGLGSPEPTTTRAIPASRMALGAGGLPPLVAAGLQGDVQNGPRRGLGTAGQSLPLRVGLAAPVVPPPADHPSPPSRSPPPPWGWERSIPSPAPPAPGPVSCSLNRSNTRLPTKKRLEGKPSRRSMAGRRGNRISRETKNSETAYHFRAYTNHGACNLPRNSNLLPSRLYCRFWNCTKSCAGALADYTADREFHPALKILIQLWFHYSLTAVCLSTPLFQA